jgi:hypothetical protein
MKANLEKKTARGHINQVEKFEHYLNYLEQLHKNFKEMGFICVDYDHDGFCPECEQMRKCKVYKKIMDEWKRVNS